MATGKQLLKQPLNTIEAFLPLKFRVLISGRSLWVLAQKQIALATTGMFWPVLFVACFLAPEVEGSSSSQTHQPETQDIWDRFEFRVSFAIPRRCDHNSFSSATCRLEKRLPAFHVWFGETLLQEIFFWSPY